MAPRPATPDPTGLAVAAAAIDVATCGAGADNVPAWIKIAHRGELRCRDGRSYTLDPEAIVARNAAEGVQVAIDVGHGTTTNDAAPAIGWMAELQARPDGLYGRPDWLDSGRAVLSARTHRYVSPAFHHDAQKRATWLHSVALVAVPALPGLPAVASAQPQQEPSMKAVATALGLQEDASEAACLSALKDGFVTGTVHQGVVAQLAAVSTELTALKASNHAADVERELEGALKAKKMLPAQKAGFAAMAATPDGLTHVRAILAATAEGSFASASGLGESKVPGDGASPSDPAKLAADARKLATKRGIPFTDALSILTHSKAA